MAAGRFKNLPGFLNQVREQGADRLGSVPGTTAGRLEALRGRDEIPEGIARARCGGVSSVVS